MAAKQRITEILKKMAHRIRLPGKKGAHGDYSDIDDSITEKDANDAITFMRHYLEHVYVLPEEVGRILEAFAKDLVHQVERIAVVETESELVKIERQVLLGDFVKDAHDATFEQRPHVLASVRVNITQRDVGLGVVHRLVRELGRVQPQIGYELIRVNFGSGFKALTDKFGKVLFGDALKSLPTDAA